MKDFLTDAEMEALASPSPDQPAPAGAAPAADFISDADMDALHPAPAPQSADEAGAVIPDAQMQAMTNPDHGKVNELVRSAIDKGMARDDVLALAQANGVGLDSNIGSLVDRAVRWRKQHGSYRGHVDLFPIAEPDHPEIRVTPKAEVSGARAFGEGLRQGVSLGFSDEIDAGLGAAANSFGNALGIGNGQDFHDYYVDARDQRRELIADADEQHPFLYGGGQVVGSIAPAFVPGGAAATGARLLGRAAVEGGIYGAGASNAQSVSGVAQDAVTGTLAAGASAGALNRVGAMLSPRVAPLVDRLMAQGVELTPTQVLRAGGAVSRTIGNVIEGIGGRGVVTGAVKREADERARAGVEAIVARQDAAVEAARAAGLNATPRHPDFIASAQKLVGDPRKADQTDMLANILLGYGSGGGTVGADVALSSIYTRPGAAAANKLLTGRQGGGWKAARGLSTKLSPLAGNIGAIVTPRSE